MRLILLEYLGESLLLVRRKHRLHLRGTNQRSGVFDFAFAKEGSQRYPDKARTVRKNGLNGRQAATQKEKMNWRN